MKFCCIILCPVLGTALTSSITRPGGRSGDYVFDNAFNDPGRADADAQEFCEALVSQNIAPGWECVKNKEGGYTVLAGSFGVGVKLSVRNDGTGYAVYRDCRLDDDEMTTKCTKDDLVHPSEKSTLTVFWKTPFTKPLIESEAAITQRFSPGPFEKEFLRASQLARVGLLPHIYEIFIESPDGSLVKHPLTTRSYMMEFFEGVALGSLARYPERELTNLTKPSTREFNDQIAQAELTGLRPEVQRGLVKLLYKAQEQTVVMLWQQLILLRSVWHFGYSLWARGLTHCDFHSTNYMASTTTEDLRVPKTLYSIHERTKKGMALLKPAREWVWDYTDRIHQAPTKGDPKATVASTSPGMWKVIDPAVALDLSRQLKSKVPPEDLVNPCGFYRQLSVEDVNHVFAFTQYQLERAEKLKARSRVPGMIATLTRLMDATTEDTSPLEEAIDQVEKTQDELDTLLRLDQWTGDAIKHESVKRCQQQGFERMRLAELFVYFPAPIRRALNKRLFFAKTMPSCSLRDYWSITQFAKRWVNEHLARLRRTKAWQELRKAGYKVPALPDMVDSRQLPIFADQNPMVDQVFEELGFEI